MGNSFDIVVSQMRSLLNEELFVPLEKGRDRGIHDALDGLSLGAIEHLKDLEILRDFRTHALDINPNNLQFVESLGGDEGYLIAMAGKGWVKQFKAACKRMHLNWTIWIKPSLKEGMSDAQKSFLETRNHGIVESSVSYVMQDGESVHYGYDGDESINPQAAADEQETGYEGFRIPYLREQVSYSVFSRDDSGKSHCVKEVNKGDIIMNGKYKTFAIYMARELPSKGQHFLVQEKLSYYVGNHMWNHFHRLLAAFQDYRSMANSRALNDMDNGLRRVYFKQYDGFVLFSPIVFSELSEGRQGVLKASWEVQKQASLLLEVINDEGLKGLTYDQVRAQARMIREKVQQHQLWYLWKKCVNPFQSILNDVSDIKVDFFQD